jgi:ferredoxin, 2Fe-2S
MPTVTFVEHNGTRHEVQASAGLSLMRAAVDHNVPGIDADCGGQCACATCHVYVQAPWLGLLPAPSAMERDMLGFTSEPRSGSRLACQIPVTEALDGLVVDLPDGQH